MHSNRYFHWRIYDDTHVLITGDFVLDNHIYQGHRNYYGDAASRGVHLVSQLGGAALVHRILEALISKDTDKSDKPVDESEFEWKSWSVVDDSTHGQTLKGIRLAEQAYAYWRPYAVDEKKKSGQQFWRVSEAMGFGFIEGEATCPVLPKLELPEDPEIVVISEGGMGFRDCEDNWPKEYLNAAKWIVFKTTAPLADGPLWQYLTNNYADKLIVIVSAWELRKSEARMSTGLSWEETLEGFFRELINADNLSWPLAQRVLSGSSGEIAGKHPRLLPAWCTSPASLKGSMGITSRVRLLVCYPVWLLPWPGL